MPLSNLSNYQPESVSRYFDDAGMREWERLVESPVAEVSLHIHAHYLQRFIAPGQRVLEIGAGAGRFTQILAGLGARLLVADISPVQLELNRRFAHQYGFEHAVEGWQQVDICDLAGFAPGAFDAVVAYGGPFSYVLDQRRQALQQCLRVLRPGGALLLSVMSLWGTVHAFLPGVLAIPAGFNREIVRTGDLTPATLPERKDNFMHLFRASELRQWLQDAGLTVEAMSASGCLSPTWSEALKPIRGNAEAWKELLDMELEASAQPGCLDMGTHLVAAARKGIG